MKKIILAISVALLAIFVAGCAGTVDTSSDQPTEDKVCCESFGYGAEMKECCQSYEWTTLDNCEAPNKLVGGNERVVDDSYCQNK